MSIHQVAFAGTINFGIDPNQCFIDNLIKYMTKNWKYSAWVGEYCKGGWIHLHIAVWDDDGKDKESFRRRLCDLAKKWQGGKYIQKRAINVKQQYDNGWLEKYMCKDYVVNGAGPEGEWKYEEIPENRVVINGEHPKVNHKIVLQESITCKRYSEILGEINKYAFKNGLVLQNREIIARDIWRYVNDDWEATSKEIQYQEDKIRSDLREKHFEEWKRGKWSPINLEK